jgi:hypothetical protein
MPTVQGYEVVYGPSLIEVEKKRHSSVAKRKTIHETQWLPMFQAIKKAGPSVWGYRRHKNGHLDKNTRAISTVEKSSYHDGDSISNRAYNDGDPEWILTQPLEELPLYMGDAEALSKECLQALRDRMSGKIPQVPYRQDLIDLYETVDDLFNAQYKIIGECTERIQKYISDRVWSDKSVAMRYHTEILAILHINGREYQWLSRQSDKLFHTPESKTVHIYEADVIDDETKNPKIKGMVYVFPAPRPPKKGTAKKSSRSRKTQALSHYMHQ